MLLVRAPRQSAVSRLPFPQLTIMTLYRLNNGSTIHSRNSIPSVKYLIRVLSGDDRSSNRIEYPTSSPNTLPTSSATRVATLVAATRRGWVHATTRDSAVQPASCRYCGSSDVSSTAKGQLTRGFAAAGLADDDRHLILLDAVQQLGPVLVDREALALCVEAEVGRAGRGERERAFGLRLAVERAPCCQRARGRYVPGATVPGFQNCIGGMALW